MSAKRKLQIWNWTFVLSMIVCLGSAVVVACQTHKQSEESSHKVEATP